MVETQTAAKISAALPTAAESTSQKINSLVFDTTVNNVKTFCKCYFNKKGLITKEYFLKKDSTLYCIESVLDGKLNGIKISYYNNGNILEVQNFLNGKIIGTYSRYYSNGVLQERGEFDSFYNQINKDTIYLDTVKLNNKEALVASVIYYNEIFNMPKQGEWKYYYNNGKIQIEAFYQKNIKVGRWHFYDAGGLLVGTREYKDGVIFAEKGNFFLKKNRSR